MQIVWFLSSFCDDSSQKEAENCFLLLGRTGVGKSTLTKILSENTNIKVGDTLNAETTETNIYKCETGDFNYHIFDTPGYDDKKEKEYYEKIKEILSSKNYKIKGIAYLFNFNENRF